ncbi:MAG: dihydrodipicolinate synthase family protein [Lachnospiraceae bacterium]|nr:dihydrodipicolinate synthase family protein [Lachnospiraceae bacterium]
MNTNQFPDGIWPVMLTPFTEDNQVDYPALKELVEWYIKNGADGLFAVCQSSEMFALSLEERTGIAEYVKKCAAGRVPVVASGHISDGLDEQIQELRMMAQTGVDAVVLITNRMAAADESDDVWIRNTSDILSHLPADVKLGLYECPKPYKRLMTEQTMRWCISTGRFYFLKDTCCDSATIRQRLQNCEGTGLKLFNANTATFLESLQMGAHGYCGVMANMHPRLYRYLLDSFWNAGREEPSSGDKATGEVVGEVIGKTTGRVTGKIGKEDSDLCLSGKNNGSLTALSEFLTMASLIEDHCYPVNAKYYLELEGLPITLQTRVRDKGELSETFRSEIRMLRDLSGRVEAELVKE